MNNMKNIHRLLSIILISGLLFSCGSPNTRNQEKVITSIHKALKEIHPGILQGYLSMEEYPNSLGLLPPPPLLQRIAQQLFYMIWKWPKNI